MWGQRETTVSMEYHGAVFELVKYQSYKSKTTYRVTGISKQTPLLEIPSTYKGNPVVQFSIDAFYGSEKPCFREVYFWRKALEKVRN